MLWKLDDSAHADLSPVSGNLLFPAKTRSKSIILRSLPDQQLEGEESFNIRLIAATGGAEISPVAGNAKVGYVLELRSRCPCKYIKMWIQINGDQYLIKPLGPRTEADIIIAKNACQLQTLSS